MVCAPERRDGQRGESPLRADALRPEAKSNCVTERWGGKQLEANAQSVGNELDSVWWKGKASIPMAKPRPRKRKPIELRGSVEKRRWATPDDWRRNGGKADAVNRGDLFEGVPEFMRKDARA